jgi:hypothetical protein
MKNRYPNATLYIVMRNDMVSMNAGKAMAQAAHAANQFVFELKSDVTHPRLLDEVRYAYKEWAESTKGGFGTTIVLAGSIKDIEDVFVTSVQSNYPHIDPDDIYEGYSVYSGIVNDPTYPIKDGEVTHLVSVDTCTYVFVSNRKEMPEEIGGVLSRLSLHP